MNRNTFATYAGLGFLINGGLLIDHYRRAVDRMHAPIGHKIASLFDATGLRAATFFGSAGVNFAALLLTGSRGATIATLMAFAVLGALVLRRSGWRVVGIGAVFVLMLVIALALRFGDPLVHSLADRGFYDANRLSVYTLVAHAILDEPLLGYGYGSFSDVFPMLRDRSVAGFNRWEMAHNIYLELLQELGLVFGGTLVICVVVLVWRCFRGAITRHKSAIIPALAASSSVLVGLHALVDFSLQVQAIALTFFAILGAGVAQSESSRRMLGD
jgi:O-antigen ligase